jgi:hypothetical protein
VKKDNGRKNIPAITGEFLSEDDIRSRAQEFFLMIVNIAAPKPLYSLRDQVLPIYKTAFELVTTSGAPVPDVKNLALKTLVDVVVTNDIADIKQSPTYKSIRRSHQRWYEAAESLVVWSKEYNLTGKRVCVAEDADPGVMKSARLNSLWPIVAGLETLLLWHFGKGGVLQTLAGVPLWRPARPTVRVEPEVLPPIRLKTMVNDPRSDIPASILRKFDPNGPPIREPNEEDTPGWYVGLESAAEFRRRAHCDFKRWLDDYVAYQSARAKSIGLVKGPGKRELTHFIWTAKYQIEQAPATRIAAEWKSHNITKHAVEKAVYGVLELVQLEPRPAHPGRK